MPVIYTCTCITVYKYCSLIFSNHLKFICAGSVFLTCNVFQKYTFEKSNYYPFLIVLFHFLIGISLSYGELAQLWILNCQWECIEQKLKQVLKEMMWMRIILDVDLLQWFNKKWTNCSDLFLLYMSMEADSHSLHLSLKSGGKPDLTFL